MVPFRIDHKAAFAVRMWPPRHVLGLSVRSSQDTRVAMCILPSSTLLSKHGYILMVQAVVIVYIHRILYIQSVQQVLDWSELLHDKSLCLHLIGHFITDWIEVLLVVSTFELKEFELKVGQISTLVHNEDIFYSIPFHSYVTTLSLVQMRSFNAALTRKVDWLVCTSLGCLKHLTLQWSSYARA